MSDYKNIIGKPIKSISSDLDNNQAEGQIWYNTTDDAFKNVIVSNAFASTGSLLDSYYGAGGAGSQTVGMVLHPKVKNQFEFLNLNTLYTLNL